MYARAVRPGPMLTAAKLVTRRETMSKQDCIGHVMHGVVLLCKDCAARQRKNGETDLVEYTVGHVSDSFGLDCSVSCDTCNAVMWEVLC